MGSWDIGSFDSDTAVDWTYGLEKVDDLSYIEAALDRVLAYGAAEEVSAAPVSVLLPPRRSSHGSRGTGGAEFRGVGNLINPRNAKVRPALKKLPSCR